MREKLKDKDDISESQAKASLPQIDTGASGVSVTRKAGSGPLSPPVAELNKASLSDTELNEKH